MAAMLDVKSGIINKYKVSSSPPSPEDVRGGFMSLLTLLWLNRARKDL